ncbi:MAG: AMP-binding protein [Pseudomonadota bacterium]
MGSLAQHLVALARSDASQKPCALSFAGRGGVIDREFSLLEILSRAFPLAVVLNEGSIGDRVGLAFPTGPEFVTSLIACVLAGKIAVPIPAPRQGPQSQRISTIAKNAHLNQFICREVDFVHLTQVLDSSVLIRSFDSVVSLEHPGHREMGDLPGFERTAKDLVLLQYTSGSTQDPKGVGISSANLFDNAARAKRAYAMSDEYVVNWMPHFHDMGLVGGILIPLVLGMPSVQLSPLAFLQRPGDFLQLVQSLPKVISGAPPFALRLMMDRVPADLVETLDLSGWVRLFCGGETVPAGLLDRFHQHFQRTGLKRGAIYATYGMTEMTLYAAGGYSGSKPNFRSVPVEPCLLTPEDKADIVIADPVTNEPVKDGHSGQICLSGASLGTVYRENRLVDEGDLVRINERTFRLTGDLGSIVDDHLYVTGRIKDILIVNGQNYMASEIEWHAASQSDALNALAAAAYQVDRTQACFLEIELKAKHTQQLDLAGLALKIKKSVAARYGVELDDVVILNRGSLPRTSSGKIRRASVKAARTEKNGEAEYA